MDRNQKVPLSWQAAFAGYFSSQLLHGEENNVSLSGIMQKKKKKIALSTEEVSS